MKKHLISMALAAAAAMSVTAVNANAVPLPFFNESSEEYREITACERLENFPVWYHGGAYDTTIKTEQYFDGSCIIEMRDFGVQFRVTVPMSYNLSFVTDFLKEKAPNLKYDMNTSKRTDPVTGEVSSVKNLTVFDYDAAPDTYKIAMELAAELRKNDGAKSLTYYGHLYQAQHIPLSKNGAVAYAVNDLESMSISAEDIQNVLDKNGFDMTVQSFTDRNGFDFYELLPLSEMSFDEKLCAANKIYDALNIRFYTGSMPTGTSDGYNVNVVEMADTVMGDANCDGEVTIADATAILQAIGNEDKYGLSAQGKFNADVYGGSDGVTGMDALTVQMYEAGVIDSLE